MTAEALDPDALAALEEQRDFLMASLDDLEAEWAAGDLAEADYQTLKDDYTARAAAVIRSLDRQREVRAARPRRNRTTVAVWAAVVVLFALGAGLFVARSSGRRGESDVATGEIRETVDSRLVEAEQVAREGDTASALALIDDVLREEPANLDALTLQGVVLLGDGNYDEGVAALEEAIAVDPTFIDPWSILLVAQQRNDRVDEGLGRLRALAEGGDVDIVLGVAGQLSAQEPVLGIMVYDTVLAVDPEQVDALIYRGWLVHLAGLDDEALEYLDRALAVDAERPDALAFRVVVLDELGRTDEARAALAAYDAVDPPPEIDTLLDQSGVRARLED